MLDALFVVPVVMRVALQTLTAFCPGTVVQLAFQFVLVTFDVLATVTTMISPPVDPDPQVLITWPVAVQPPGAADATVVVKAVRASAANRTPHAAPVERVETDMDGVSLINVNASTRCPIAVEMV